MSIFGNNIKKIRILRNMSQQEFGDLFDISRGSIGSYEEDRAEPKIDTVIKIAAHFKLSIDVLLTKELTINELSNFTNKISKLIDEPNNEKISISKKVQHRVYLEDKVEDLESRISKLEEILKKNKLHE
jgi:transcriptional regulator with XRE-family HTH domain